MTLPFSRFYEGPDYAAYMTFKERYNDEEGEDDEYEEDYEED